VATWTSLITTMTIANRMYPRMVSSPILPAITRNSSTADASTARALGRPKKESQSLQLRFAAPRAPSDPSHSWHGASWRVENSELGFRDRGTAVYEAGGWRSRSASRSPLRERTSIVRFNINRIEFRQFTDLASPAIPAGDPPSLSWDAK
jgi:hypothetical protein